MNNKYIVAIAIVILVILVVAVVIYFIFRSRQTNPTNANSNTNNPIANTPTNPITNTPISDTSSENLNNIILLSTSNPTLNGVSNVNNNIPNINNVSNVNNMPNIPCNCGCQDNITQKLFNTCGLSKSTPLNNIEQLTKYGFWLLDRDFNNARFLVTIDNNSNFKSLNISNSLASLSDSHDTKYDYSFSKRQLTTTINNNIDVINGVNIYTNGKLFMLTNNVNMPLKNNNYNTFTFSDRDSHIPTYFNIMRLIESN